MDLEYSIECSDVEVEPAYSVECLDEESSYYEECSEMVRVLIIANETFSYRPPRAGSIEAALFLKTALQRLEDTTVDLRINLTTSESSAAVLDLADASRNSPTAATLLFFLSYGNRSSIMGTDEREILISDLCQPLSDREAVELTNVLKIGVFHSCHARNSGDGDEPAGVARRGLVAEIGDTLLHNLGYPKKFVLFLPSPEVQSCPAGLFERRIPNDLTLNPAPTDIMQVLLRVNESLEQHNRAEITRLELGERVFI